MNDLADSYRQGLEKGAKPPEIVEGADFEPLVNWLGRLRLLYGVPFRYLVPREELLPNESIRFFHVDPDWIAALVDGAFSVGRATQGDEIEAGLSAHFDVKSAAQSQVFRAQCINNPPDVAITDDRAMSGFLLRSDIVSNYPGLEISGFGDPRDGKRSSGAKLDILRLERIGPRIMLCLFKGELEELTLNEPPEGIFFGVNAPDGATISKDARFASADGLKITVDIASPVSCALRNKEKNVLNIEKLSQSLAMRLGKKPEGNCLSPSEFAFQMVESAGKATFSVDPKKSR